MPMTLRGSQGIVRGALFTLIGPVEILPSTTALVPSPWKGKSSSVSLPATSISRLLLALIALIPLVLAILARRRRRHGPAGDWDASSGQQSNVKTDFLDMAFDHDSGALDGHVAS